MSQAKNLMNSLKFNGMVITILTDLLNSGGIKEFTFFSCDREF